VNFSGEFSKNLLPKGMLYFRNLIFGLCLLALPHRLVGGVDIPPKIKPFLVDEFYPVDPALACRIAILKDINDIELRGGKRWRPLFVFLSASFLGIEPEEVLPLAVAIEWIHTGSLMQDDLVDGDNLRRNLPTMAARGVRLRTAVLGGDFIILSALEEIEKLPSRHRLIFPFIRATKALPKGELEQDQLLKQISYNAGDWRRVARLKTGALFGWAWEAPFIVADTSDQFKHRASEVGVRIGELFQLWDDLDDSLILAKRGELNRVLLRAGQLSNTSPFSSEFAPAALEIALAESKQLLLTGLNTLLTEMRDLHRDTRAFREKAQVSETDSENALRCFEQAIEHLSPK
jgi:geranylgeranyl pyrophosphate synthase